MTVFLWTMVAIGVLELACTIGYALKGEVPERTPQSMAFNAAFMFGLGMWAFWLLCAR